MENVVSRLLNLEKKIEEDRKKRRIWAIIRTALLVIILIYLWFIFNVFRNAYDTFTSESYLNLVQEKAIEVTPLFVDRLSEKAPDILDSLREEADAYLPILAAKISDEYIPLFIDKIKAESENAVNEAIVNVEWSVNTFLQDQIDTTLMKFKFIEEWNKLSNEQFQEVREELKSVVEMKVNELLSGEIVNHFKECADSSELLIEKVDELKDKADYYEVIKSFINILQNMEK